MHVSAFGETRPQPYQDVVVERSYLTGFRFLPAMRSPHEPSPAELSQLLASLVAFLGGHRYCGELDSGARGRMDLDDLHVWGGHPPDGGACTPPIVRVN